MTQPSSRDDLLAQSELRLWELLHHVDTMSAYQRRVPLPGDGRDRSVADVLAHLRAWHALFVGWVEADAAGEVPAFPADGYTWDELDELNVELRERFRLDDLDRAIEALHASHAAAEAALDGLDDEVLADPARYPWLGGQTLLEVAHECLGGHYVWARDELRARYDGSAGTLVGDMDAGPFVGQEGESDAAAPGPRRQEPARDA
ncbi:ClbS/DfsB family four-helix bundle protein [Agromyces sp. SYSU T00194]|uniref:ClbS/DfsB family four-helix bundle protein n=1 Tax=Agromyces chitinivorans TaxID=3158560 RepID=UPI003390BE44